MNRTPTNVLKLTGNPGHRPLNKSEATPDYVLPKTPLQLDALAKKIWNERGSRLVKLKLMSELDNGIFMGYCQLMSWALQLMKDVAKEGTFIKVYLKDRDGQVIKDDKDNPMVDSLIKNPKLVEARLMFDKIRLLSGELGMTPAARAGINIPKTEEEDEMAKFMSQVKNG